MLAKLQIIEMTMTDVMDVGVILATHQVGDWREPEAIDVSTSPQAAGQRPGLPSHRHQEPAADRQDLVGDSAAIDRCRESCRSATACGNCSPSSTPNRKAPAGGCEPRSANASGGGRT